MKLYFKKCKYFTGTRQYDAEIGRWSAIDPALQAASPYMAMGNNPMMMIDQDGEWFFAALAYGALIGAGSYTASIAFSKGGFDNWNWGGFFQSAGIGAVSGVATAGIGNALNGMSGFGTEALRAGMHGVTQGGLGALQGDNFFNGFASGALSSLASSGFQALDGQFARSKWGGAYFGAISGGVGAELSGGDFWRGAGSGATVALLNHFMHQTEGDLAEKKAIKKKYSLDGVSLADAKSGGDIPFGGLMFYNEKGNLLYASGQGNENIIYTVGKDNMAALMKGINAYKDHWAQRRPLIGGKYSDPNYFQNLANSYGSNSYSVTVVNGNVLGLKRSTPWYVHFAAASTIAGEGLIMGKQFIPIYKDHTVVNYWNNKHYSHRNFNRWWQLKK